MEAKDLWTWWYFTVLTVAIYVQIVEEEKNASIICHSQNNTRS
jgi:hypothetical protein